MINQEDELEEIMEKLRKTEIIDRDGYKYIILPFDYQANPHDVRIFSQHIEKLIKKTLKLEDVEKIVTIESKGILVSTIVSLDLDKPLYIIRKRQYNLEGEMKAHKTTAYAESDIFINGISKGDKIIIVDDLISTGGTMDATLQALQKIQCKILGIFSVFDKPDYGGSKKISEKYPIPLKTLIKLTIDSGNKLEVKL